MNDIRPFKKQIFIINGSGGVGKDTFVEMVGNKINARMKRLNTVWNYSSVDKIKDIAREIGWEGGKTERDRKFLSDLKTLASNYCDMPYDVIRHEVGSFCNDKSAILLFLHIREPSEVERAAKEFNAKTILVVRDNIEKITSNSADKNVFDYEYDLMIANNGTLRDLEDYIDLEFFTEVLEYEDPKKEE